MLWINHYLGTGILICYISKKKKKMIIKKYLKNQSGLVEKIIKKYYVDNNIIFILTMK